MSGRAKAAGGKGKVGLRHPDLVMRLSRLGSLHQCRLSFMRVLLRRMNREKWSVTRSLWQIDANGVGRAVYTAKGPQRSYSLVAFAHDLPDHLRSDRVIAEAWDATFCLFDGMPDEAGLERLAKNVPKQEAGRVTATELSLSRANRSARLWQHVVDALAAGRQPDREEIAATGYLMRTTAVYGSGKFGAADRDDISGRRECAGPFQLEMLSVYLTREFVFDLVDHLAAAQGGDRAARLDRDIKRGLGIGNSTGLGMAPFLVNHPTLLNAWIAARETALARVRNVPKATAREIELFRAHLEAAQGALEHWRSEHPFQQAKLADCRRDLAQFAEKVAAGALGGARPWDRLFRWAQAHLSVEGQEKLVSLMMEPYGDLVDELAETMSSDEEKGFRIDGTMSIGAMRKNVERCYGWALHGPADDAPGMDEARFWYVSQAKLEPRLGERETEAGADLELPLDVGRQARIFHDALGGRDPDESLATLLLEEPRLRNIARRAQIAANHPYSEIRDNLIAGDMMPIDMLRCKLSFFGATRFDPRSDRWVRISMYQNAPLADEIGQCDPPDDLAGTFAQPVPVRAAE